MAKLLMKDESRQMKIEENKPEKLLVIGAGLPRTGTLSMKTALTMLLKGKCYHMAEFFTSNQEHMDIWVNAIKNKNTPEQWKQFFKKEGFIAGVDFPFALFWKELSDIYPEAKVILTTRESSKWYDSVKSSIWIFHDKMRSSWTFNKTVSLLDTRKGAGEWIHHMETTKGYGMKENLYDVITGGPEAAENFFKEWESVVRATIPPERLLVHSAKEGWEPLCKFLDLPVPDRPYPRLNDAASIRKEHFDLIRAFDYKPTPNFTELREKRPYILQTSLGAQTVGVLSVVSVVLFYVAPVVAALGATYYFAM